MTSADFAAAQARIAERRRLRQVSVQSQQDLRRQALDATSLARLPAPLSELCTSAWAQWDQITSRQGTRPALRVGQVDAELLDEELLDLFKGQVEEALKYYGQHLRNDWHAEIQLALRTVLFKLTIWDHDASYGATLQNLKYIDARGSLPGGIMAPAKSWQKAIHGIVSVGGRYGWSKWTDFLLDQEGGYDEPSPRIKLLSRLSTLASTTHSVVALASFMVFLVNGQYRTVLDRILRLRLTPRTTQVSREVSFEYLNRQLVWHAFTEFLLFLLPLVGISRWRRWIARAWRKTRTIFRADASADEEEAQSAGELGFLPERTCAICYQDQNPATSSEQDIAAISASGGGVVGSSATDVTNPYETIPCGCIYCYVCIAQRLEGEDGEGWTCLRCAQLVKECQPWGGDVIVEERGDRKSSSSSLSKSAKRVKFLDDEKTDELMDDSFQTLEPMPLEDDPRTRVLSQAVDSDGSPQMGNDESAEWSHIGDGVDVTPPPELESGNQSPVTRQTSDSGVLDAAAALVSQTDEKVQLEDEDEEEDDAFIPDEDA